MHKTCVFVDEFLDGDVEVVEGMASFEFKGLCGHKALVKTNNNGENAKFFKKIRKNKTTFAWVLLYLDPLMTGESDVSMCCNWQCAA